MLRPAGNTRSPWEYISHRNESHTIIKTNDTKMNHIQYFKIDSHKNSISIKNIYESRTMTKNQITYDNKTHTNHIQTVMTYKSHIELPMIIKSL